MINQMNQPVTHYQEETSRAINPAYWGTFIGLILTLCASFVWSGLVLAGMGLLCLSFGLILVSVINHHYHSETNWTPVLSGQFLGVCGIALLLISTFLK